MSNRAHNLLLRAIERIQDGPKCKCGHDTTIHYEGKCLGAVYDRHGAQNGNWCTCQTKYKEIKHDRAQ